MDVTWTHLGVALAAALSVPFAMILWRRPKAAIASVEVRSGAPFTLRATLTGATRLWIRYDLAYGPVEDAWRVDGEVRVTVHGAPAWSAPVTLRFNEEATSQPRRFGEGGTFYGVSSWHGAEDRGTALATAFLGAIDAPSSGAEVVVSGTLTAADGTRPISLTLFVSR